MKRIMFGILLTLLIMTFFVLSGKIDAVAGSLHGGDIVYKKPVKSVIFSHKVHVEDRGLSCEACHSGLFEPTALKIQEKSDFNMDSLYNGKYCGACHNGKTAFASNTQCARCHIGVKGLKAYEKMKPVKTSASGPKELITIGRGESSVKFSHETHIKSFGCGKCHSGMFPMSKGKTKITMNEIYQGQSCGACHDGKKAFSSSECNRCHEMKGFGKDLRYKVEAIGDVVFSHKFHTTLFSCDQCHPTTFQMKKTKGKMAMEEINKGKYCGTCHNGSMASPASDCGKCHLIGS